VRVTLLLLFTQRGLGNRGRHWERDRRDKFWIDGGREGSRKHNFNQALNLVA